MTGDQNAVGHADYGLQSGPGIVRAQIAGSVKCALEPRLPVQPVAAGGLDDRAVDGEGHARPSPVTILCR
jgi:hypothetical protein